MNIEQALAILLKHEGGYVNHPSDPGGETNYGITRRVATEHGYTGSMRDIPMKTVTDIYRRSYWDAVRADQLPEAMRYHVFDAAVSSGVSRAVRWLQECGGAAVDGVIGPRTIAAAANVSPAHYSAVRLRFMSGLSTWPSFGKGWVRRICDNLELIK